MDLPKYISEVQVVEAVETPDGRIGCGLSHLKCLKMAKEQNLKHVLILEDDVVFKCDATEEEILGIAGDVKWDVILLGVHNGDFMFWSNTWGHDKLFKIANYFSGTHSVLVNGAAYDRLIAGMETIYTNIGPIQPEEEAPIGADETQDMVYVPTGYDVDHRIYSRICSDNMFVIVPFLTSTIDSYSDLMKDVVEYGKRAEFVESFLLANA